MYSPKINEDLIQKMYQRKQRTGKKITHQANEAIREYLVRLEKNKSQSEEKIDKVNV